MICWLYALVGFLSFPALIGAALMVWLECANGAKGDRR
jgi:hypothetical protein